MAVRALNSCVILRVAGSPPVTLFRRSFRPLHRRKNTKLGFVKLERNGNSYGSSRSYSIQSLFDTVMEELIASRRPSKTGASKKLEVIGKTELLEDRIGKPSLQKGFLLEFKKDSERVLLAVVQRPDGKKNWMVSDQNGTTTSIKPQQVTYIVPGAENFDYANIAEFVHRAQDNLDPTLLEFAWLELLEKNKSVTVEELAEMIFGSSEPLESYCTHLLLSKDEVYFTVLDTRSHSPVYGPRPAAQVEELHKRKLAKEAAEKEFQEFIQLLKSARELAGHAKPPKSSWLSEERVWRRIESLEAYAIDACKNEEQKKTAGAILKAMGQTKTATAALNLLIDIGHFPVHVNLDMLKFNVRTDHPDEVLLAAERLLEESHDVDKDDRVDMSHLKVYAIDVDEADELDDALSATKLQDGRIKVWIHVADPTSLIQPGSVIDKEAMKRGTSIFLPTATYPMFPEKLAMERMSLQQGERCNAVSVSVVLHFDGSIAEYTVENSVIKPTYMLTYESASELLHLNLSEEAELKILSEAALLRLQWRRHQGAIDTATLEARIKVANPDDPDPAINLYVGDQSDPAMRLVTEMMILCGEVMATFGSHNNISLPYRGQPQSSIDISTFAHLPEGPVRSSAIVKTMRAAEMDFRKPIRHGVLGLPGYVQFTSPIRRYMDLLAHYQVKAHLRGDTPFSAGQMEGMASVVNMNTRIARRLSNSSLRYWTLEYLRRQPKGKRFSAFVLRFIKDRTAAVFLIEVGLQASAWVSVGVQIGDKIQLEVEESHPRDDILSLKEIPGA